MRTDTKRRSSCIVVGVVLAALVAAGCVRFVPTPHVDDPAAAKCSGDLGDPVGPSPEWDRADLNNQQCATEGLRVTQDNPAVAAATAANAAAGEGQFFGDPFRAPHRWAGKRGSYERLTYTDRDGNTWPAALFGPLDPNAGPYPGVILACHACFPLPNTTENIAIWYWAAEALAEAGYVVLYATIGGNSDSRAIDATDFFLSTPEAPTAAGEVNPWHARLDRSRLAIVGHSGAAGVALRVGNSDARFDTIVAWDPASSSTFAGVTPRIPTMIQVADYTLSAGPVPRTEKPVPTPGSKYTFFDSIRAAGIDVMQIGVRASTHLEWTRATGLPHSIYGEMVATYYTLAWLDRYLAPARLPGVRSLPAFGGSPAAREALSDLVRRDALRRLTASGTDRFDRSADVYSIGAGFYDAKRAARTGDPEAGNVPITMRGLPIRNLLSFQYDSRYFLDGGSFQCADMRAGCRR